MSSPADPPFDPPEDRSSARGQSASGSGPSVPPWDPSVPGPRDGADRSDGWSAPGGYGGDPGYGGQGYGGQGYGGPEPGAGYAPGYGDPYGGGPTVGGPNAYGRSPSSGPTRSPGFGGPGTGGWAPKPGVVPLRPLGLGEILDGAVSYIRAHARVVLGVSAVVAAVAHLVGVPLSELLGGDPPVPGPNPSLSAVSDAVTASATAQMPLSIVVALATTVLAGLLMVVVSRAVLGAPVDAGEAWRAVRSRIAGLVGIALLSGVLVALALVVVALPGILLLAAGAGVAGGILLGLGLLAGIAAAIAIGVGLSLAPPVYVLEGGGVIEALRRSWALVKPRFWPVLGITVLTGIMAGIAKLLLAAPFGLLAGGLAALSGPGATSGLATVLLTAVGGIVAMALVTPFQAGVTGLLYIDQRMRREGFDIELQRAASSGPR